MVNKEKNLLAEKLFDNAYKLHLKGKIDEAIEAYKTSIEFCPTAKTHTLLAWAYSLKERFEDAIIECYFAIELDPELTNLYIDIGSYLMKLNRYNESIWWFEKALEEENHEHHCYAYYNLGIVYEKKGDWLTALRYYNKALHCNHEYELAQTALLRLITLLN